MKRLLLALALCLLPASAWAQSSYTFPDFSGTSQTTRSFNCSSMICPLFVPTDITGAAIWGTAGAANANVMTVQGIASMTPFLAAQSGAWNVGQTGTWNVGQSGSWTVAATQSGIWTVQPGNTANTTPWLATINQGGNSASVSASNALKVDGSAVTQPVSLSSSDPCVGGTKLFADFSASVGGTLVSAAASKKIYLCSISMVTAAAANVSLIEGTGATCTGGTPASVFGNTGTTAANGFAFGANGGIQAGNGGYTVAASATNNQNICAIFTNGTPQVNVHASYVQQ